MAKDTTDIAETQATAAKVDRPRKKKPKKPKIASAGGVTVADVVLRDKPAPEVAKSDPVELPPNDDTAQVTDAAEKPAIDEKTELKKKELFDLVVQRSGIKKPMAKASVEAALAVIGEAIARGEDLNLEPLGKMKVQKQKEANGGMVYTLRLRRKSDS